MPRSQRQPPRSAAAPGRRRLQVDERRQLLIDAAQKLFSTRSVDEVSVDDIAAESHASRALLYHYFDSKQDLYVAALREAAEELVRRVEDVPDEDPPALRLAAALRAYVDYAEAHATGFVTLLRGGPAVSEGEVGAVVQSVRDRLLEQLISGFRASSPPPLLRLGLRSWIAVVETAVLDWLDRRDLDRDALERYLLAALPALHEPAAALDPTVPPLPL